MKLICENIKVQCVKAQQPNEDGNDIMPNSILWRCRLYRVRAIQGTWRWRGGWWTTPSLLGQERLYFRVLCSPPGGEESVMELYRERGRWTLSRLLD